MSLKWLPLLIAPALLASACGGDGSSPTPSPTPTPSPAVVLPSPTPEPTPEPTPAPAARNIVFSRPGSGVYLIDTDGAGLKRIGDQLYKGRAEGAQLPVSALNLEWSPDGTKAAFWQCPEEFGRDSEIYVVHSDGSGLTNVSNDPAADGVICYSDAPRYGMSWSPDSDRIAFWSGRDPNGLYVVDANGSGLKHLTNGAYPRWSPAGDSLIFVEQIIPADDSTWETPIYAIDPDHGNRRLIASVPSECSGWALWGCTAPQLRWSPDGTLLAFTAVPEPPDFSQLLEGEDPNHEVFILNADGTGLTNITSRPGEDYFANWVDCDLPLPTAGCELKVTNVQPQRLNLRDDAGTDQEVTGKLSEGETVCLLGSPGLADGFQWWPVRSGEGSEGWAAAFDPDEPDTPWLTATGRTCQGEQVE